MHHTSAHKLGGPIRKRFCQLYMVPCGHSVSLVMVKRWSNLAKGDPAPQLVALEVGKAK